MIEVERDRSLPAFHGSQRRSLIDDFLSVVLAQGAQSSALPCIFLVDWMHVIGISGIGNDRYTRVWDALRCLNLRVANPRPCIISWDVASLVVPREAHDI